MYFEIKLNVNRPSQDVDQSVNESGVLTVANFKTAVSLLQVAVDNVLEESDETTFAIDIKITKPFPTEIPVISITGGGNKADIMEIVNILNGTGESNVQAEPASTEVKEVAQTPYTEEEYIAQFNTGAISQGQPVPETLDAQATEIKVTDEAYTVATEEQTTVTDIPASAEPETEKTKTVEDAPAENENTAQESDEQPQ